MLVKLIIAAGITTAAMGALISFPAGARSPVPVSAAGYGYGYDVRPGWGYGDDNHVHTGPPGRSEEDERPGWGFGDDNHDHQGPPGIVLTPLEDEELQDREADGGKEDEDTGEAAVGVADDGAASVNTPVSPGTVLVPHEDEEEDLSSQSEGGPTARREKAERDERRVKPGKGLGDSSSTYSGPPGQVKRRQDS